MNSEPHPLTRRRLLKQTFAFSAAAILGQGYRQISAQEVVKSASHLLMIGDWGPDKDWKPQEAVARGMAAYAKEMTVKPEAMFLLGDNFYGSFKGGLKNPRWKSQFEDMYPAGVFPGPCYAMLGNHDYDDEPEIKLKAELAYAAENPGTRWTLPAKWYRMEHPQVNSLMTVLVLDSNYKNRVVSLTSEERQAQDKWLREELAKPRTTPWLVVMGHHPLYTNGVHGDSKTLIAAWDKLFREHQVDFYFCGHDHDMQHMEFEGHPTSFVLSGGGGARVRNFKNGVVHGPFGQAIHGFTHLEVTQDRFVVRHIDANRKLLHAFEKDRSRKVTIVS